MKKFIPHNDEKVIFYRSGSKEILTREYIKFAFILIVMMGFMIHCSILTFNNHPEGYTEIGWKAILIVGYTLLAGLIVTYLNSIITIKTTQAVLTNKRLVYTHKGLRPKYSEIQLEQIKYTVFDDESMYINEKNGDLIIVKKNETKETFKNIQDAFDMDVHVTEHIVNELENKNNQ